MKMMTWTSNCAANVYSGCINTIMAGGINLDGNAHSNANNGNEKRDKTDDNTDHLKPWHIHSLELKPKKATQ